MQRGHAVRLDQLHQAHRVAVFTRRGDDQAAAADQGPEALPHRHVKTHRGLLQQHIVGLQAVGVLHPRQALRQRCMRHPYAFGVARGT